MVAFFGSDTDIAELIHFGHVATRQWLLAQGVLAHRLDHLLKTDRLIALAPGVYRRWDTELKWQGVVSSLQIMGYKTVVGGLTALEQNGLAHYLNLSGARTIHLYGEALPSWLHQLGVPETFQVHSVKRLFTADMQLDAYTDLISWAEGIWNGRVSTPERAIMEALDAVPDALSFEHADQLMQGLTMLSPRRLGALLPQVRNVKVKRLFFWLARPSKISLAGQASGQRL